MVGIAVIGLISIMLTMIIGWLWVAALASTASKVIAGALFAATTTIELLALSVGCNKR